MRLSLLLTVTLTLLACARMQYNMFLEHHQKTYYTTGHVVSKIDSSGLSGLTVIAYGDCLLNDSVSTETAANGLYTMQFRSMLPLEDSTDFELPLIVFRPGGDTLSTKTRILFHDRREDIAERDIVLETVYF